MMKERAKINQAIDDCQSSAEPVACLRQLFVTTNDGYVALRLGDALTRLGPAEEAGSFFRKAEQLLPDPVWKERARARAVETEAPAHRIARTTRRDILDVLALEKIAWAGELTEDEFLARLWDLNALPSHDVRFKTAARDIYQHRVLNPADWDDDWLFSDSRFDLTGGSDEVFLKFLCETVHPRVRSDTTESATIVSTYNELLEGTGWEIHSSRLLGKMPLYEARRVLSRAEPIDLNAFHLLSNPEVLHSHLRRIDAGLAADPASAIGSSKELVESLCKMILDDYGVPHGTKDGLLDLYKKVADALKLKAEAVPQGARGSEAAQRALRALVVHPVNAFIHASRTLPM